jgi:hypothetical protein
MECPYSKAVGKEIMRELNVRQRVKLCIKHSI